MGRRGGTAIALTALLLLVFGGGPAVASARGWHFGHADEVETAWFAGKTIRLYVDIPDGDPSGPPPQPDPHLPSATVYLIAPIDPKHPQDPGIVIPSPPAPHPIIVPVHDTVLEHPRPFPRRANCFGVQVFAGPDATAATVLTRKDPNGGGRLAWAIRAGGHTRLLNSSATIRYGARNGLLRLDTSFPGYGGTCWTGRPGTRA